MRASIVYMGTTDAALPGRAKDAKKTSYAVGEEKIFYGEQDVYLLALASMPAARIAHCQLAAYYKAVMFAQKELPANRSASFYRSHS